MWRRWRFELPVSHTPALELSTRPVVIERLTPQDKKEIVGVLRKQLAAHQANLVEPVRDLVAFTISELAHFSDGKRVSRGGE